MTLLEVEHLDSQRDAAEFIETCVVEIGLGFHPDTNFNDYEPPVCSPVQAIALNALHNYLSAETLRGE
jgi:hypothetical protein